MIPFACPGCGKQIRVKDELAGKKVRCPGCGNPISASVKVESFSRGTSRPSSPERPILPTTAPKSLAEQVTVPPPRRPEGTRSPDPGAPGHDSSLTDFLSPPQADDELGRLGGFRILKVLGHGGMGVVFQGEDTKLGRKVAIKAMLPHLAGSKSCQQRFLREARAAAALEHDHIVPIFHVGEDRGAPFIVMPFLKGEPLDQRLKRDEVLPIPEGLRIGREVALGLDAAHAAGLIHRDVKPANVWLEAPEGHVKILDFGLARSQADPTHLTQTGAIVGTPAYMAPEQATGQTVDHRCDLFSLGCVLYRMATGELPFKGGDTLAILSALALDTPKAPREVNPAVPAALSDLVLRLLAKRPEDRPATAREVAAALAALAEDARSSPAVSPPGETTTLHRPSAGGRWRKPATVLALLASLGAVGLALSLKSRPDSPGVPSPEDGRAAVGPSEQDKKDPPSGPGPLKPAPLPPLEPDASLGPMALVRRPAKLPGVRSWTIETRQARGSALDVAFRPDGKRVAVSSLDGVIRVWEPDTGRLVQVLFCPTAYGATSLAWSPDGVVLAAAGREDPEVCLWDPDKGRLLRRLKGKDGLGGYRSLCWSSDGKGLRAVTADWKNPRVSFWDVATGEASLEHSLSVVAEQVVPSPDGRLVAVVPRPDPQAGNQLRTLALYDGATGKQVRELAGPLRHAEIKPAWSRTGDCLAAYCDGDLIVWNAADGKEVVRATLKDRQAAFLSFGRARGPVWSPDGKSLAAGSVLIDVAADSRPRRLEDVPQAGSPCACAWSAGTTLGAISEAVGFGHPDGAALYDGTTGKRLSWLAEPSGWRAVDWGWLPDGRTVRVEFRSSSSSEPTRLVSADTGRVVAGVKGYGKLSPDGKVLAAYGDGFGNTLLLRDRVSGKGEGVLNNPGGAKLVGWSPDSKRLVTVKDLIKDPTFTLWDVATCNREGQVGPVPGWNEGWLAWSPDGRLLALGARGGWLFWDLAQGKAANDPKQWQSMDGNRLAFAPNGKTVAFGDWGGRIVLRDRETGKETGAFPCADGSENLCRQLAWSPDGTLLAVVTDRTIQLWQPAGGARVRILETGLHQLGMVPQPHLPAWSHDGKLLAVLQDGLLKVWDADGRPRGCLFLSPEFHELALTAEGHYRGGAEVERHLVAVVQGDDGTTEVLEPAEFQKRCGWKNDPDKIHLCTAESSP